MSHGQQYYLKALWIRLALTDQRAHGYVEQNLSRKKIILEIKLSAYERITYLWLSWNPKTQADTKKSGGNPI